MSQYSPELIEQTVSEFESRAGRVISDGDARQAVENICGFFRVLQEWYEAGDNDVREDGPAAPSTVEGDEK